MEDERTQFDESIREILSSTEEEVPSRVWEGIEARLDGAASSKKPVVAWWKVAAGAMGVAAAVAAAFVVSDLSRVSTPEEAALLAEAPSQVEASTSADMPSVAAVQPGESSRSISLLEKPTVQLAEAASAETSAVDASADENPAAEAPVEVVKSENRDLLADAASITVDNSDIEAVYGKEETVASRRSLPLELTLGANSGAGPQKNSSVPRLYAKGTKSPSATTVVENANPDSYNIPLSFGLGVKFRILDWLSIGTGINYTLLGKKVSATYYEKDDYDNTITSYTTDMKNTQHYIGVPLDVYFRVFGNKNWEAYALVGGTVEKCFVNHYGGKYEGTSISYNKKVSGVQTSVKAGFGVEYSPVDFLGIYIDPSVRYYFNNNQPRSIRTAQPLAFGLEAGLRFKI